jgi:hypothetical protein
MPSVNWNAFGQLPGSTQDNFEQLCRVLIRTHYGRFGQFAALANQPGVEFHLKLHTACALGDPGRWFGWQCRWYDAIPNGKSIGTVRRNQIEKALRTTENVLPGVTDWVLWTRHPLTKGDQKWFYGLKTRMRLDLWTGADAENLLSGEAEIFRATYFGELVLTPDTLAALHVEWVARIRRRWLPEVHQPVDAERTLRRMLGEAESWDQLMKVAARLKEASKSISADLGSLTVPLADTTTDFVKTISAFAVALADVHKLLTKGDLDLLRQQLGTRPGSLNQKLAALPRQLRAARNHAALMTTNAVADLRLGQRLLDEVNGFLGTRLIGVLADAGGGKTQLAAQLTSPSVGRPAGVLLYGQDLHAGHGLDELARKVVLPGKATPVPSMEALVAALDAAGQRYHRRLPLVIDGLNEAETPRDWKGPLAILDETLRHYPYVLVVCTLRTGSRRPSEQHEWQPIPEPCTRRTAFADEALPDGVQRLEIPDFAGDTMEAIRRYFRYYRISPGDADLPIELLSHPLTLRLFCEVTNPARDREVGIEKMPGSLTALFGRYLDQAALRIAELAPRTHLYYEQDVRIALDVIGNALWEQRARDIDERELRRSLGDETRPWNESIIRALEQEGVILRMPGDTPGATRVMAVYDAMAGHLVGSAILSKRGRDGLLPWLKDPATMVALTGSSDNLHPLATDIFHALVGLVPRRLNGQQLWPLLDEPLRAAALRKAAQLEGAYLDAATITALARLVAEPPTSSSDLFVRLYRTRGAPMHPLNANFLDSVLRSMGIAERDLRWTEWIRRNRDGLLDDLRHLEERWRRVTATRTPLDLLRARWGMWMLTSTIRELRDQATRTLYWFGRGDPAAIFELTYSALAVNDPYVSERMLAASYGVAMARHVDFTDKTFVTTILPACARRVYELIFKENAPHSTTHVLTREYSRRILELASLHHRKLFSSSESSRIKPPYKDGGLREWKEAEANMDEIQGRDSPFHMDFGNYTLGRLVPGRGNYEYGHLGYQKVRAQVLWRVEQLGWSAKLFKEIDQQIASHQDRQYGRFAEEKGKIERYGKKYSWIAYFEMAGFLRDQGKQDKSYEDDDRSSDVEIDPSFPVPLPKHRLISDDFLGDPKLKIQDWIVNGGVPDVTPYLRMSAIQNQPCPWVALDGFFTQEDGQRGRGIFCFIRSFLVARNEADAVFTCLSKQDLGGRWLPEIPAVIYTFAGEIPWCATYPKNGFAGFRFVTKEERVKVKRKRQVCFLDGKQLPFTQVDLLRHRTFGDLAPLGEGEKALSPEELQRLEIRKVLIEEEEIREETRRFNALIPVREFGWEGRSIENESVHGTTLAKEIARDLQLVGQPQTFDSFTKQGARATFGVSERRDFRNGQNLFLIREDLLKYYLKKKRLALIWAIWGEREYATKLAIKWREDNSRPEIAYKVYQMIKRFDPESGRVLD